MPKTTSFFRDNKLSRTIVVRPRLFACWLLGLAAAVAMPASVASQVLTRALLGWNLGVLLYLILGLHMMFSSSHQRMRTRAVEQDEGRLLILAMVMLIALVSLGAIVGELAVAKDMHGIDRYTHIALAITTLVLSWAFTHLMFALHYAHDYYAAIARRGDGGLLFPGRQAPDYTDFLYFSFIIGTSGQTADVAITGRIMRRSALVHCILAFFFNATLIALAINIASSML